MTSHKLLTDSVQPTEIEQISREFGRYLKMLSRVQTGYDAPEQCRLDVRNAGRERDKRSN